MRLADGLVIAAPSSGSGKTVITFALLAALRRRGIMVAGAKSGPDYLDPRFHELATGQTCFMGPILPLRDLALALRYSKIYRDVTRK